MLTLQVYPGSLMISGTLGNLRVCDMFLGADHQWGWLCDIRDPGAGSLVEVLQTLCTEDTGFCAAIMLVDIHPAWTERQYNCGSMNFCAFWDANFDLCTKVHIPLLEFYSVVGCSVFANLF
jgi:hypothetical protein